MLNKDFYNELPSMVCELLDRKFIPHYGKEKWFDNAWEEYRQHILQTTNIEEQRMPAFIFNKYLNNPPR